MNTRSGWGCGVRSVMIVFIIALSGVLITAIVILPASTRIHDEGIAEMKGELSTMKQQLKRAKDELDCPQCPPPVLCPRCEKDDGMEDASGRIKIALMQPVMVPEGADTDLDRLIPLAVFLPTVIQTFEPDYDYVLYYGYDVGDPFFDDAGNVAKFMDRFKELVGDRPIYAKWIPLYGLGGRMIAIWNVISRQAYEDGCDYFFPTNDDVQMLSPGWATAGIETLAKHTKLPRFGMAAFRDVSYDDFPTFHLTHRTHYEIFGAHYYPLHFTGAFCDPWMFDVYRAFDSAIFCNVTLRNHVDADGNHLEPRYAYGDGAGYPEIVKRWRLHVYAWLKARGGPEIQIRDDWKKSPLIVS